MKCGAVAGIGPFCTLTEIDALPRLFDGSVASA
jgi:hypothetical protein